MAATLETRVMQLEQELRMLRHDVANVNARNASPQAPRLGRFLAVLKSPLAYNGTATAETLYFDGSTWKRSGTLLTVRGFWLNSDETDVPSCTLLKIEWFDDCNSWVPTAIYCKPNNWLSGCT